MWRRFGGFRNSVLMAVLLVSVGCAEADAPDGAVTMEVVDADQLHWELVVGESEAIDFVIENRGDTSADMTINYGASWLDIDVEDRELGAGQRVDVEAVATCGDEPFETDDVVEIEAGEASVEINVSLECREVPTGGMEVTVDGLPQDREADITLTGGHGFEREVTETTTVDDVPVGSVEIHARSVGDEAVYEPETADQTVDVEEGVDAGVDVSYQGIPGDLQVEVEGLDGELEPALMVSRDGQLWEVPGDGLVEELEPGPYTVVADDIVDGETTYGAADTEAFVASSQTEEVTVSYIVDPGALDVDIEGLPQGINHNIEYADVDGNGEALPDDGSVSALEPGDYELMVGDVTDGPATYQGDDRSVTIVSDETTQASVDYEVSTGAVEIVANGLPDGLAPNAVIDGPDGSENVDEETTVDGLIPGDYTVTFEEQTQGPATYRVDDSPLDVVVESGSTTQVVGAYEAIAGDLEIDVETFGSADFEVSITGPEDFSAAVDGDDSFSDIVPGNYDIDIVDVPVDDQGNDGWVDISPGDSFEVTSDDTTTVSIAVGEATRVASESDDGPGSLRYAVESVSSGSSLHFDDGVETITVSGGDIAVDTDLEIIDDDEALVIEADGNRIFDVESPALLTLQGVTLQQGDTTGDGGAIRVGGGASMIAERVVFEQNSSDGLGGAVFVDDGADVYIREALFRDNFAEGGSSIGGGAVGMASTLSSSATVDIEASLFDGNSTNSNGGAVALSGSELMISESTFVDNEATDFGGGISVWDGDVQITGATIVDNNAATGGGIEFFGDQATELALGRSIVADNSAVADADIHRQFDDRDVDSLGYNVVGIGAAGLQDGDQGDQVGSDTAPLAPELQALAENGGFTETMPPESTSPAHASVPAQECEPMGNGAITLRDQRWERRPAGAFCNAGAYELNASTETFANADMAANMYEDGDYSGDDGVQWHYEEVRREEGDYAVEETSVILREEPQGSVWSEGLSGGIDSLSLQMSKAFTGGGDRQIEVLVDGDVVATSTAFDDDGDPPYPVIRFGVEDIDVSGNFDIEIKSIGDGQVAIDNISWR